MNPSGEKPVYGLNSWGKDVALGYFIFLSLGLHFENMVSPKNTSTQPENKSGLSRNTESPEDAFLCVRGIQEYMDPDCPPQNEGIHLPGCEVIEEEKRQFQYSTNWTSDHLSLQVAWVFSSDLFCGGNRLHCVSYTLR